MLKSFVIGQPAIAFIPDAPAGGDPAPLQPGETQTPPNAGENGGNTYTQEQLDRMFADRAKRSEDATKKALYESLGVKDEAGFTAFVEAKKKADDANKNEAQKAMDELAKTKKEAADKEAAHTAQIADLSKRLLDTEIKQLAGRQVTDKDGKVTRQAFRAEALDDIPVLIAREGIQEKDGKYTGIEEALAALAKAKPHWLADGQQTTQKPKGTPPPGQRPPAPPTQGEKPAAPQYVNSL